MLPNIRNFFMRAWRNDFIKLIIILLLFSSINYFWLSYDTVPPDWDRSVHLMSAMNYHTEIYHFIKNRDVSGGALFDFLDRLIHVDQFVYPPLVPLTAGFIPFVWDSSLKSLSMVNILFMGILLFSVYQVGKKIHNEQSALLAGLIILLYPMVFGLSRTFMLEFPLLAMTALSFYFLLYSDEFRNRKYTILFGISFGLGMLTKPQFLTFIVVPLGYIVCLVIFKTVKSDLKPLDGLRNLAQLLVGLVIGILIAGLWYGPNFRNVTSAMKAVASINNAGLDVFSVNRIVYYLNLLVIHQIGLFFFGLFIYSLFKLNKDISKQNTWLLLLWALGIYVMLTLVRHKTDRQDIGILLPMCLISAIGISSVTRFRKPLIGLVMLFGIFQFGLLSLPESLLASSLGISRWGSRYYFARPPKKEDWKIEEALRSLGSQKIKVGVLSDHISINGQTVGYYARLLSFPFTVRKLRDFPEDFINKLSTYDFIITKSDWIPNSNNTAYSTNPLVRLDTDVILLKHFQSNIQKFALFKSFHLPDGSDMLIYKRLYGNNVPDKGKNGRQAQEGI